MGKDRGSLIHSVETRSNSMIKRSDTEARHGDKRLDAASM